MFWARQKDIKTCSSTLARFKGLMLKKKLKFCFRVLISLLTWCGDGAQSGNYELLCPFKQIPCQSICCCFYFWCFCFSVISLCFYTNIQKPLCCYTECGVTEAAVCQLTGASRLKPKGPESFYLLCHGAEWAQRLMHVWANNNASLMAGCFTI